jgi:hypothetical protein
MSWLARVPQTAGAGRGRAVRRLLAATILLIAFLVFVAPASAYDTFKHATATSKSSCSAGCHAGATPTNATCVRCHTGFAARGTQKCWDCHAPGQATSAWQLTAGCTGTCHVSTKTSGRPSYTTTYAHAAAVHLGASGYGKTCVACHGVSTGPSAPGTSPHHDAVDSPAPACADCHDGATASAPGGHEGRSTDCASCHTGMDRPIGDCAACHVGAAGTTAPQIAYTNALACADSGCHGKVANHAGTPISSAACTTCHAAHYETLGSCQTCHPDPQTLHHGTATARPLADCAGCHDGGVTTAKTSHSTLACSACHADMTRPAVPAVCSRCHLPKKFGTATCTTCHSLAGLSRREQIHNVTPNAGVGCTSCHSGHNADLGVCTTCHGLVPEAHHGVAAVTSSVLTLQASPAAVTAGSTVTLGGAIRDAGGAALSGVGVLLQERRPGAAGFADVATLTTGADGGYSHQLHAVASAEYRAVYRGAASVVTSAAVTRPAIATASISVARSVRLSARPGVVKKGARVTLAGAVAPTAQQLGEKPAVVGVRVERRTAAGWSRVAAATVTAGADGAFSWTWRPKLRGSYRARATVAASSGLLAAASLRVVVRVR